VPTAREMFYAFFAYECTERIVWRVYRGILPGYRFIVCKRRIFWDEGRVTRGIERREGMYTANTGKLGIVVMLTRSSDSRRGDWTNWKDFMIWMRWRYLCRFSNVKTDRESYYWFSILVRGLILFSKRSTFLSILFLSHSLARKILIRRILEKFNKVKNISPSLWWKCAQIYYTYKYILSGIF